MRNKLNVLLLLILSAVPILHGQNVISRKVLVMLVNFSDRQEQPLTKEQVQTIDNSVNAYYIEQSYGKAGFTFDVMDWQTLPMNAACDKTQIASLSETAAVSSGFSPANYQHRIYVFPGAGCGWTGSATLGGANQVWINTFYDLSSAAHELGHNLGLLHSSLQYPDGTISEYGDRFDVMGSSQSAHFNLYQKEQLGWANVPEMQTGVYFIDPIETSSGIKIHSASGEYYIERRTGYGFDSIFDNANFYPNVFTGFLIHFKGSYRNPFLLDMTPETVSINDPALTIGRTFSDGSISISALSTDEVSVTVPEMTPTPTPLPTPVCLKSNPKGKCLKWN